MEGIPIRIDKYVDPLLALLVITAFVFIVLFVAVLVMTLAFSLQPHRRRTSSPVTSAQIQAHDTGCSSWMFEAAVPGSSSTNDTSGSQREDQPANQKPPDLVADLVSRSYSQQKLPNESSWPKSEYHQHPTAPSRPESAHLSKPISRLESAHLSAPSRPESAHLSAPSRPESAHLSAPISRPESAHLSMEELEGLIQKYHRHSPDSPGDQRVTLDFCEMHDPVEASQVLQHGYDYCMRMNKVLAKFGGQYSVHVLFSRDSGMTHDDVMLRKHVIELARERHWAIFSDVTADMDLDIAAR